MRSLDVLFAPTEFTSRDLHGKLIFPVDVLRFTTSAAVALASGAMAVYPFDSLFALRSFADAHPGENILTAGEVDGVPIPGLDLGNSPAAFTPEASEGKDVLMVTTNGTGALKAVEGAGHILPFAFVNLSAVADRGAKVEGEGVVLCAGWRGRFAQEDSLAAGALVVESLRRNASLRLTESARAARDLYIRASGNLEAMVRATEAAARLESLGFGDDVAFCLRRDTVPVLLEALGSPMRIVLASSRPAELGLEVPAPAPPKVQDPEREGPKPESEGGGDGDDPGAGAGSKGKGDEDGKRYRFFGLTKGEVDSFRMPLGSHLMELRRRIIFSLIFALVGFVAVFLFRDPVVDVVLRPVVRAFDGVEKAWAEKLEAEGGPPAGENDRQRGWIIANAPQEKFMSQVKISFIVGLFFASPFIFWQLWLFVSAGLYPLERKWVFIFAPATYFCFAVGIVFLYFVVLPLGLKFLLGFGYHPKVLPTMGYGAYVGFFLLLAVVMGSVFELPLVMLFLARLGLIHPRTFALKRKYFIVVIFLGAALLTPPDVITQVLVALPLLVLYEIGILLAKLAYKERKTEKA